MNRKLHIGGTRKSPGWEVLNITPGPHVDHACNANDLSCFDDNTFSDIYASHVLEHFDYASELLPVLKEWYRVLKPGGKLHVSVPDLDVLAQLLTLKGQLTFQERFLIMRMIFGGHIDKNDYHYVGLNRDFLNAFLSETGFINIRKVDYLGFFEDTSCMLFRGVPISLNMVCEKPL
jgi:predicted SAM-dependent methyltransferase